MAIESAFVEQAKSDLEYHIAQVAKWRSRLYAKKRMKLNKGYSQGSRELWHSLIDFYGVTKGRQKWAEHLRARRQDLLKIERQIRWHQKERDQLKRVLRLYSGCFLGIRVTK